MMNYILRVAQVVALYALAPTCTTVARCACRCWGPGVGAKGRAGTLQSPQRCRCEGGSFAVLFPYGAAVSASQVSEQQMAHCAVRSQAQSICECSSSVLLDILYM